MHGLKEQTFDSLKILRETKTRFIVILNKVDLLYGWQKAEGRPIRECLERQKLNVMQQFEDKVKHIVTQLMEKGFNSKLYWENDDLKQVVSLVPTSAETGEGK